jgi:hypothetical protein
LGAAIITLPTWVLTWSVSAAPESTAFSSTLALQPHKTEGQRAAGAQRRGRAGRLAQNAPDIVKREVDIQHRFRLVDLHEELRDRLRAMPARLEMRRPRSDPRPGPSFWRGSRP